MIPYLIMTAIVLLLMGFALTIYRNRERKVGSIIYSLRKMCIEFATGQAKLGNILNEYDMFESVMFPVMDRKRAIILRFWHPVKIESFAWVFRTKDKQIYDIAIKQPFSFADLSLAKYSFNLTNHGLEVYAQEAAERGVSLNDHVSLIEDIRTIASSFGIDPDQKLPPAITFGGKPIPSYIEGGIGSAICTI